MGPLEVWRSTLYSQDPARPRIDRPLGERYRGDFKPIVSQELFIDVQRRLGENPTSGIPRRKDQNDFPLRRFARCA